MKGQYFLKDKKAQHYKVYSTGGGVGDPTYYIAMSPAPYWCYCKQLTQEQLFAAQAYWNDETRFFVFNNKPDIKQYDLLLYKGNWFQVTRVDTTDDYNGETFVYAKDAKGGNKPRPQYIKPYGWQP